MVYTHIPLSEFYELDRKLKKKRTEKRGTKREIKETTRRKRKKDINGK